MQPDRHYFDGLDEDFDEPLDNWVDDEDFDDDQFDDMLDDMDEKNQLDAERGITDPDHLPDEED